MAILACACGIAIVVYLWACDPAVHPAPQCLFRRLTGYDCPGCGTQRAIHAMLHGDFRAAWHYNAALLPGLAVAALYAWRPRRLRRILFSSATPYALAALVIGWWVGRNLW